MQDLTDPPLPKLRQREPDSHKGDFGRVLVIAGSRGMAGAAGLAGMAALRSGAGLVAVATPAGVQATVASYSPCYTTIPLMEDEYGIIDLANSIQLSRVRNQYDAWAIGPGLGQSEAATELIGQLYRDVPCPMVVDADALNALAHLVEQSPQVLENPAGPRVLTPHPGEYARLTGNAAPSQHDDRVSQSEEFASRDSSGQTVVVLKGHRTIIATSNRYAVNQTGNPGMATGGSGDCLTGVLVALLGQGLDPFEAARLAVHVHGLAGDFAAEQIGQISLVSSDLLEFLPGAFLSLQ